MKMEGPLRSRSTGFRRTELLYALLIAAFAFLFYFPATGNDFVMFDDDINIYNNPMLGALTWDRVAWAFTDTFYMPRYMPLGWISLMAVFEVGGLDPASYHTVNVVLHAANAALVYVVIRRGLMMIAKHRDIPLERGWCTALAACGAVFWAIHPLRVEPVSWVTGLHYLHATFWALISVLMFWGRLNHEGRARLWRLIVACICYLFSVLVYPVTLGLPAALWVFEWWLRPASGRPAAPARLNTSLEYAPLVLLSGAALAANVIMRHFVPSMFPPSPGLDVFGLWGRALQASYSALYYVIRPLYAGEVTPVYDMLFSNGRYGVLPWLSVAGLGLLILFLAVRIRRFPGAVVFCVASGAVGVSYYGLLESPFQTSDRYTYFPSLVVAFGLAIMGLLYVRGKGRVVAGLFVLPWLAWLAAAALHVLPVWRNDDSLFNYIAGKLKAHDVAALYKGRIALKQASLGQESAARATLEELKTLGAPEGIVRQLEGELSPLYERARVHSKLKAPRGWVAPDAFTSQMYALRFARSGDDWTSKVRFQRALAIDPGFIEARYNYSLWLAIKGNTDQAWAQYCLLAAYPGADLNRESELALLTAIKDASGVLGNDRILVSSSRRLAGLIAGVESNKN